jgi:hypothetical protein
VENKLPTGLRSLKSSGNLTLIGSAALLWHADERHSAALDSELRQRNSSLRAVVKEIPSVFGSFFE